MIIYDQRWVLVYKKLNTCAIGLDVQDDGDQGSDILKRLKLEGQGSSLGTGGISRLVHGPMLLQSALHMPRNSKNV
jgi:hypothetical protein